MDTFPSSYFQAYIQYTIIFHVLMDSTSPSPPPISAITLVQAFTNEELGSGEIEVIEVMRWFGYIDWVGWVDWID